MIARARAFELEQPIALNRIVFLFITDLAQCVIACANGP